MDFLMIRKILSITALSVLLSVGSLFAQIEVDTTLTPTELVQQVLLGNGVSVSNITFNGQSGDVMSGQIGTFTSNGASLVEFPEAIVMRTGHVELVEDPLFFAPFPFPDPEIENDPDLMDISGFNVNDCAILEFDFVPNGDSLVFRYVFASTEYNNYTCASYNDAFGFFISGPGITGPFQNNAMNIALIPNSDIPVAVNTVNSGVPSGNNPASNCEDVNPNWQDDTQYFVANTDQLEGEVQFNGMTVTLTAYAEVVCGQEYHIKLAVGDATDGALDSGVFLEAGSFTSNSVVQVNLDVPVGVNDSTLYEGCGEAYLQFIRPNDSQGIQEIAYLNITGTATNGVDFTPFLPDSVVFLPGIDTVFFALSGVPDSEIEGQEFVNVEITNIASNCSGAVLTSDFQFYINEADPLQALGFNGALIDCHDEIELYPTIIGGYGEYSYNWSTGETTDTIMASPGQTTTIFVTVSDTCGVPSEQASFAVEVPVYDPILVDLGEDFEVEECDVTVDLLPIVTGGFGAYSYAWIENATVIGVDPTLEYQVAASTTIQLVVSDDCDATGNDEVIITIPDIIVTAFLPDIFEAESCLDDIMLPVISEGGIGQKIYTWIVDGEEIQQSQSVFFLYNPSMGQNVVIVAEDECQNIGTDSTVVEFNFPAVSLTVSPDSAICESTPVYLHAEASEGSGAFHIKWQGEPSEDGNYEDWPDGTTTYTAMAVDTCGMTAEARVHIEMRDVKADFDYKYYDYYSMEFTSYARATNPIHFWDFGDGDISNEINPKHRFRNTEEYDVVLTVVDDIGCIDTAKYTAIPPIELYVPNSFTPNGDGINDLFGVKGANVYSFEMIIFDRWGKEVFRTNDMDQKWNGSNQGNDYHSQTAVYNYTITYKGKKEEDAIEITGFITVTR